MEQTEVREQILDTARDLFQKQGFGKTSMDDIARHLGRAKSGIYYYFKSKHAILEELVRREIERMEEEVEWITGREEIPADVRLKKCVRACIQALPGMKSYFLILRDRSLRSHPSIQALRTSFHEFMARKLEELFGELKERGRSAIHDSSVRDAFLVFLRGCELLIEEVGAGVRDRLKDLADLLVRGIRIAT
ncbi:regulatory protein TetR [Spirochaeta thermophila DSM 6578]|uniref:Regulatory protein TetR n=1 Tax=Winmispira thermophila (strain ATCC 700085 / DSM 6578 / Z-1203) TaxID=869211 RepID=G0GEE5_WINT7|nr:TetR/AcrR family transcriptional regulator [Spirochaeta thermophila]AEJ62282.1 regulatory protein TetR [Spirochaeta thermophila DSM 6578]